MHALEKYIFDRLRELDAVRAGDLLLVGVSGGADSVALLHLLAASVDRLKVKLCAVYVDHGLRFDEAAAEKKLVENLAAGLGVDFKSGKVAVNEFADDHGLSIEAAARSLRYRYFEETAGNLGAAAIVVAHTADDQVEEVLLRLIRGTGRNGLSGMLPVNFRRVIRPLLAVPKERLLSYIKEKAIPFCEDSSNLKRDFLRNRVRLDLLPYLEDHFNPAIRRNLLRTADILGVEDELLNGLTVELYGKIVTKGGEEAGYLRVDTLVLVTKHLALQRRIIEKALVDLDTQPSFQHVEKLLELAGREGRGGELHLPEGLRAIKRGGYLEFSFPKGKTRHRAGLKASKELSFETVIDGPGRWPIDELEMDILIEVLDELPSHEELVETRSDFLDMMTGLDFPLIVRRPKPGDRFHPLGGPGSRKISDFLSDRKIPREKRSRLAILTWNEDIVALPGIRIDDKYRLRQNSRKVLKVSVLPR